MEDSHEWLMWQAADALRKSPPPQIRPIVQPLFPPFAVVSTPRRKRSTAWAARLQRRVNYWLKGKRDRKLEELLGYSVEMLRSHLERQFKPGMTWGSYAGNNAFKVKRVWVVDHIVPKRLFDESDAAAAFAITNLRPLWIRENLMKNGLRWHLL